MRLGAFKIQDLLTRIDIEVVELVGYESTKVSYFRKRQKYFTSFFFQETDLVHCNDAAKHLKEQFYSQILINGAFSCVGEISWKAVLLL